MIANTITGLRILVSGTGIIKGMMGIGSKMLLFFEQKGKDKGYPEFVVWVLEENSQARDFYEKNNYCSDGREKIFKRWNKREIRYINRDVV